MPGTLLRCERCGFENPEANKYCGECGKKLSIPTKIEKVSGAIGLSFMAIGLVALILASVYYVQGALYMLFNTPLSTEIIQYVFSLSGEGFYWPGLTVGVLLCVFGIVAYAWPRINIIGRSGKWTKAIVLVGGLLVLAGAIIGTFSMEIESNFLSGESYFRRGTFSYGYLGLVLTGFSIIMIGVLWTAWKQRVWPIMRSVGVLQSAKDTETKRT
jgi:hypothetical protein